MPGSMKAIRSELRPGLDGSLQEVRLFTNPAVQQAIDTALNSVTPGKKGVILEVNMPETGGVKGVVAARLNDHWSIGLVGAYDGKSKTKSGGARVAFEW
jgi:hypothetical protein